jgi:hypothetical protein
MRIDTPAVATHLLSDPDRLSPRAFVAKLDMLLYDCYHIPVKCNH